MSFEDLIPAKARQEMLATQAAVRPPQEEAEAVGGVVSETVTFRWRVRAMPESATFPHGVPEAWVEVEYEPHEWQTMRDLRKLLDDPTKSVREEAFRSMETLHEFKALLGARIVPDDGGPVGPKQRPVAGHEPYEEGEPETLTKPDDPEHVEFVEKVAEEHGFPLPGWEPTTPLSDPDKDQIGKFQARGASDTQKRAALAVYPHTGTERRRVLDFIVQRHPNGATDEEMQNEIPIRPNTQRPRRVELHEGGWIERSSRERPGSSGEPAKVWVLTDKAMRHLGLAEAEGLF